MQGKWAEPGVPHRGWTCVGVHDVEDERQTCEMCEGQEIRYVHAMEHPNYPDKSSAKGNSYLKTRDGFHVVVFPTTSPRGQWTARVEDTTTGAAIYARRTYPSETEAKLAGFDAIIALKSRRSRP